MERNKRIKILNGPKAMDLVPIMALNRDASFTTTTLPMAARSSSGSRRLVLDHMVARPLDKGKWSLLLFDMHGAAPSRKNGCNGLIPPSLSVFRGIYYPDGRGKTKGWLEMLGIWKVVSFDFDGPWIGGERREREIFDRYDTYWISGMVVRNSRNRQLVIIGKGPDIEFQGEGLIENGNCGYILTPYGDHVNYDANAVYGGRDERMVTGTTFSMGTDSPDKLAQSEALDELLFSSVAQKVAGRML